MTPSPKKILLVNKYFYRRGGAETSAFLTARALQKRGHQICWFSMQHERNSPSAWERYFVSNVDFSADTISEKVRAVGRMFYSLEARRKLEGLIQNEEPDLAHLNNIYHHLSPSILGLFRKFEIPVVMTMRDFKPVCPSYRLYADGKICQACRGGRFIAAPIKCCHKNSRLASFLVAAESYFHNRLLKIYESVDVFTCPSKNVINILHSMGFEHPVFHLPNFVPPMKGSLPAKMSQEPEILYFGRLVEEKGLRTLIQAVKDLRVRLVIAGEGPLYQELTRIVEHEDTKAEILLTGRLEPPHLAKQIDRAWFTVFPSLWPELQPRSILESFARGRAVVASDAGGVSELVHHGETGLMAQPGNASELSSMILQLLQDRAETITMGKAAKKWVHDNASEERFYMLLMTAYSMATQRHLPEEERGESTER